MALPLHRSFVAVLLGALVVLSGCMNYLQPFATKPAHPGLESTVNDDLHALPPPREPVVVAVYRFRDQTGQYKLAENAASWSTAVTQGATSILMRALEESGWFVPIEREGLSNLLNERQIIQSTRAQHGEAAGPLPPLLFAGVLLEGGIIGYDSNTITGGTGLRYFGAGPSGGFRQDQVTIYLRAVSTQSGRVLKTVHTTKTIVSQKLDGGLFRFVDTDRLLETEAGYTYNEPPVLAVTEAIEEAVKNLVVEGVREQLWALADPADAAAPVFAAYDAARADADRRDYFGRATQTNRPSLGLGVSAGAVRYEGNYVDPLARPAAGFHLRAGVTPRVALGASFSAGELSAAQGTFERAHVAARADVLYYLLPRSRVTPFLEGGLGLLVQRGLPASQETGWGESAFPYVSGAVGLELMATRRLGLSVSLGNDYALLEGLDGVKLGRVHDNVWRLATGLTFYPF